MHRQTPEALRQHFRNIFGGEARVYRAPGRVNLIGEHTDYNDGLVMPAAIDAYVWAAIAPRQDSKLVTHSSNFSETVELDLAQPASGAKKHWSDYVQGIALMLQQAGHSLRGANLLISGEVPIGSGLSSSAAIEVAAGFALLENAGLAPDRRKLAQLCRRAENEFVGARVGIMDQFISCFGRAGHALLLDCRSLEYRQLPLPSRISLVICNTTVKHEHGGGEYNRRRVECEEGVQILSRALPEVRALRDVSLQDLETHRRGMPETIYKRCHHVVSENLRVEQAAAALGEENFIEFGRLMRASHDSLRDDYQVSCKELDLMVDVGEKQRGVYGARMTGGGFGGCTINLVKAEDVASFQDSVAQEYERASGLRPQIFVTSAAEGAGEVN